MNTFTNYNDNNYNNTRNRNGSKNRHNNNGNSAEGALRDSSRLLLKRCKNSPEMIIMTVLNGARAAFACMPPECRALASDRLHRKCYYESINYSANETHKSPK